MRIYMKNRVWGLFACLLLSPIITIAAIDDNADTVLVRMDCGVTDNCFTSITVLSDWIAATRQPNKAAPLLIDVGVGEFNNTFKCTNVSHITMRGSGRLNSAIIGNVDFIPGNNLFAPGMVLKNCANFNVSNISVEGEYGAIWWHGSGESSWTDVDVTGAGRGFYQKPPCDEAITKHSWFNSRIVSTPFVSSNVTYTASCGETWLHNTEITTKAHELDSRGWSWSDMRALWAVAGTTRVIGGILRTDVSLDPAGSSSSVALETVRAEYGAVLRITAAAIEIDSSVSTPIYALVSDGSANLSVASSSYDIVHPSSLAYRQEVRGGVINAVHHWGSGVQPPDAISVTGQDQFIESDCSVDGCHIIGNDAHLLIYDSMCLTDGPWFDTVTQRCRGV